MWNMAVIPCKTPHFLFQRGVFYFKLCGTRLFSHMIRQSCDDYKTVPCSIKSLDQLSADEGCCKKTEYIWFVIFLIPSQRTMLDRNESVNKYNHALWTIKESEQQKEEGQILKEPFRNVGTSCGWQGQVAESNPLAGREQGKEPAQMSQGRLSYIAELFYCSPFLSLEKVWHSTVKRATIQHSQAKSCPPQG